MSLGVSLQRLATGLLPGPLGPRKALGPIQIHLLCLLHRRVVRLGVCLAYVNATSSLMILMLAVAMSTAWPAMSRMRGCSHTSATLLGNCDKHTTRDGAFSLLRGNLQHGLHRGTLLHPGLLHPGLLLHCLVVFLILTLLSLTWLLIACGQILKCRDASSKQSSYLQSDCGPERGP